jgi:ADP-ribosylglycohydrolase
MKKTIWLSIILIFSLLVPGCTEKKTVLKISVSEYRNKVLGSWYAQVIGNIYGLPHECRYIEEPGPETWPNGYSSNAEHLKNANGAFSDDDTDIEYIYLLSMEKYGEEPRYEQLGEMWKYHIRDRVWLANRGALVLLHYGFTPPITGMKDYNPHWFQIDPQLVNEIWGVTAPGMIKYAAQKSAWAARITNDDWGIEPTIHYGAMYSAAFFESDVNKLIDIGTAALPINSRFAQTVQDMKALYKKYPGDWKQARKEMVEKYYHNESVDTRTIWNANLNGACGILALLYGQGNFQKTLDLSCAIGMDADNQAATMSGLLGVILGAKALPKNLLFPFPELGWQEPFNDFYKNETRYDVPDASLKDMANRMALQGEKIILRHGGKKISENGVEYYLINQQAEFISPIEFPAGPLPVIEIGKPVDFTFWVTGGTPPFHWKILSGAFPDGLTFEDGRLMDSATRAGIYHIELQVEKNGSKNSRHFEIVVREPNLAISASEILASVKGCDPEVRDHLYLTVGHSLFANDLEIIRDGKWLGVGSTFFSLDRVVPKKIDYYGYAWKEPHTIGLLGFHTGAMEEIGGWFTSLNVEYRNDSGNWEPVENLVISPTLPVGNEPYDKPHFVEYLLAFEPVNTTAIRMIGDASVVEHWSSQTQTISFTSIAELSVHGALPGYERLRR